MGKNPHNNYKALVSSATKLFDFLEEVSHRPELIEVLNKQNIQGADGLKFTINGRLALMAYIDAFNCYERLGYGLDFTGYQSIAFAAFLIKLTRKDADNMINSEPMLTMLALPLLLQFVTGFNQSITRNSCPNDRLMVVDMLRFAFDDAEVVNKYVVLFYRFASVMAKADGSVNDTEAKYLSHIMSLMAREPSRAEAIAKVATTPPGEAMNQLNSLIGLEPVKEEVNKLASFIKVQLLRKQRGMTPVPMSYHCVFTGNPGTGKTTVARILAGIYRDLGILKKGHLIETDRSGLVAEYVGQTAVKTNKIIDSALDGVLFIDEAYSLITGASIDYGGEAIATLLKRMEDDRDRLIVILAGYNDEMKQFIDSNPGLKSRFNRYINFPDYSATNLLNIFKLNISTYDYVLDDEAHEQMRALFVEAVQHKDKNFGNGRFARNMLEKVMENQAVRLSSQAVITQEMLRTITQADTATLPKP